MAKPRNANRPLSELKNLGPVCQEDLNAVGIETLSDLQQLGAEKAFLKMLEGRKRNGKETKCCNAAYLYAIYGAINDIDWRDIPSEKKLEFKAFTAELRRSKRVQR
jgi:hypothetical protein